jgi:ATP-dependent helicase HrpA
LLGYLQRILPKRPDLRVIISSATLEHERFSEFFGDAPVLSIEGRTFPVDVIYRAPEDGDADLAEAIAETVEEITSLDPRQDILVFLPGEREIAETHAALTAHALPHTVVQPLYGRLAQADQARIFQSISERRIVLATNVAETSLTIPGIVFVIDSGLARVKRHNPRTGVTQLLVEPISRASADQRKGRAGRTQSGVCYRLYDEKDYATRAAYTDPEILRVGLAGSILQMMALDLGEPHAFPFLDPPQKRAIDEGYRVLEELGAIDDDKKLTEIGKKLSRLPLDPRIGRMILAGAEEGVLSEVLVIAAALGIQDPRERPMAAQQRADEAHRRFRDESSDFAGLLKLWRHWESATKSLSQNQQRKLARDRFLSFERMRQWIDVHNQLARIAKELGFDPAASRSKPAPQAEAPSYDEALHRALLPGLLTRVGMWNAEQRTYLGARQTRFQIHPSSALAKKPPAWIVATELAETSQLFARTVARIDPAWLEAAGGSLCKRSYGDPSWTERSAQVMAPERVTLYGLPIVRDRRVHFGPIDPRAARRIFIIHALVRQEYHPEGRARVPRYVEHNRAVFEKVRLLREKARKSEMMADDDAVASFFEKRVPDGVYSGKTFEAWRAKAEVDDPKILHLSVDDVLAGEADELTPERFPDALTIGGAKLPLSYRFDPSAEDDGITLTVPIALLSALDPAVLEWTIPGWQEEKVTLLCHSLPKAVRKAISPIAETARTLARELRPFERPMLAALGAAIFDLTGTRVSEDAWSTTDLPPHLSFYFRVVDGDQELGADRSLRELQARFGGKAREAWASIGKTSCEREGLTTFAVDELPERVSVNVGRGVVFAYPGLVDMETSVAIRTFPSSEAADVATRAGLRRLFLLELGGVRRVEQQFSASIAAGALAADGASPRRELAARAIDEAFDLGEAASLPRTRAAFNQRLLSGKANLPRMIAELGKLAQDIAVELDRARADLRALVGKPGAPRSARDDVRTQIEHLVPKGLLERAPRDRLAHLPRFLRAIRVRLERLPNGPQKDQAKAAQVLPFWQSWLSNHERLRKRGAAPSEVEAFRWLVEEFRVSLFAPELRTAVPVSSQRLTELWKAIESSAG